MENEQEYTEMFTSVCCKFFSGKKAKLMAKGGKKVARLQEVSKNKIEDPYINMKLDDIIKMKSDYNKTMWQNYDPSMVESHWNSWWEHNKFYHTS